MKLPEIPYVWEEVFEGSATDVFKIIEKKGNKKLAQEFNEKYLHWEQLKHRVKDEKTKKAIWAFMKLLRSGKYQEVPFKSIPMKYSLSPSTYQELHKFDKYMAGNIEAGEKSLELEKRYIISTLMEEAIASSILEGASTTRKVAKEMLKKSRKPNNNSEKMIVNGYVTLQLLLKRLKEPLTPGLLLEIHELITEGTIDNEDVGKFRDNNDIYVGHSQKPEVVAHKPPDYKELKKLTKEFCDFANDDSGSFTHPIIKGIILHFLLGYIHPFNDGNGRTARSVFYWYVLSRGYWLFEYVAISRRILRSRKNYDLAYLYTETDENDLTYFINYNIEAIDNALKDMMEYINRKKKEHRETEKIFNKLTTLNSRQASILKEIMETPGKNHTIKEISQIYNTVYQTARTDLLLLAKKGYLTKKKISKAFVFSFQEKNKEVLKKLIDL